jgi:hypothetical protein
MNAPLVAATFIASRVSPFAREPLRGERCLDGRARGEPLVVRGEHFDVTLTFGYTPESRGLAAHHTGEYADFCAVMVRRYAC